jgi:hypothetical protein
MKAKRTANPDWMPLRERMNRINLCIMGMGPQCHKRRRPSRRGCCPGTGPLNVPWPLGWLMNPLPLLAPVRDGESIIGEWKDTKDVT